MINLQNLNRNITTLNIDGQILEVYKPNQALLIELLELKSVRVEEALKVLYAILTKVFNNNTDGDKYKQSDLEKFVSIDLAMKVLEDYLKKSVEEVGK